MLLHISYVIYNLTCILRNLNLVSLSMILSNNLHDSFKTCFITVTLYSSVVFRYCESLLGVRYHVAIKDCDSLHELCSVCGYTGLTSNMSLNI